MQSVLYYSSGNYTYKVTYNLKPGLPKCKSQYRELPKIRKSHYIYFDKHDNLFKEIVYPKELHYTEITVDDPVEHYIDCIRDFVPDWTKIEIE